MVGGCMPPAMTVSAKKESVGFEGGDQIAYDVEFHSRAKAQIGRTDSEGDKTPFGIDYECDLTGSISVVRDRDHRHWVVSVKPRSLVMKKSGIEMAEGQAKAASEMSDAFLVTATNRGAVQTCQFSTGVSPTTRRLLRVLAGYLQFDPAKHTEAEWTATEDDAIGTRSVLFKRRKSGELTKIPQGYVANTDPEQTVSTTGSYIVKSANNRLVRLHGSETSKSVGKAPGSSSSLVQIKLEETKYSSSLGKEEAAIAATVAKDLASGATESLWQRPSKEEIDHDLARQTLGSATKEGLIAEVQRLDVANSATPVSTDLVMKLVALLALDPTAATDIVRPLSGAQPLSPRSRAITGCLVGSGTPPAQHELMDYIIKNLNDRDISLRLIPATSSWQNPTAETIASMTEIARGSSIATNSAILALGGLGGRLRESNQATADSITNFLAKILEEATDPSRRLAAMGGLGNLGTDRSCSEVEKALGGGDSQTRGAAVVALRLCRSDSSLSSILRLLKDDKEVSVREKAVFALSFRPLDDRVLGAVLVAAKSDPSSRVRLSAIELLAPHCDTNPAIATILEEISRSDPSEDVRKRAHDLIHKGAKP